MKSPSHALFGRSAYAKFMARPCYVYLQLKMPGYKGTITVHGSRKIALEVAFGDDHDSRSETLTFEVGKIQSPYHALFGRPAYAKFMARPCYIYLQLKMPGHKGQ